MAVRHTDSTSKNLLQCEALSIKNDVIIPDTFWRTFHCSLGCGGCCKVFTLDYLPHEWDRFTARYSETMKTRGVRNKKIITILHKKQKKWCYFLDTETGACAIHDYVPLSCKLELIKIKRISDKTYLTKGPYARAWAMRTIDDCAIKCEFSEFSAAQLFENDMPTLKRLLDWSNYFGIKTHLPDILQSIEQSYNRGKFSRIEFLSHKSQAAVLRIQPQLF